VSFAIAGQIILQDIFHIDINALKVAGGFVLFKIGFDALESRGMFTLKRERDILALTAVPAAMPLIAGPAAITAVITLTAEQDYIVSLTATAIAIVLVALSMFIALYMMKSVNKTALSITIRVIGLFIMAIGAQMMVEGVVGIYLHIISS